nr:MAG TPA: Endodeoxyribonuclease RusA [Caudoviricetes sp.]
MTTKRRINNGARNNHIKGISDALNGIVVKDDSQIVDILARKFYSDTPRIEVVVTHARKITNPLNKKWSV